MTMLETIIREFPVSDFSKEFKSMSNTRNTYTKEEVDTLIAEALAEARRIDEESMAKHNSCLLYTSPSPRDDELSRMPSSA